MRPALGDARSGLKSPASTDLLELQTHRETREKRRAHIKAQNNQARLRASGRLSSLPAGKRLLMEAVQPALAALTELLATYVEHPPVGRHYAALPMLERFTTPRHALVVALRRLIDHIGRTPGFMALAEEIGGALEAEHRAALLVKRDRLTWQQLRQRQRHSRKQGRVVGQKAQQALDLTIEPWPKADRLQLGCLMLELLVLHTQLIEVAMVRRGGRTIREVVPLPGVIQLAADTRAEQADPARTPMLVPPRPWAGMHGGGHLTNEQPLIRAGARGRIDLAVYEGARPDRVLAAVNHLQRQELRADPWMIETIRRAWQEGVPGAFPVRREPLRIPPLLPRDASQEEWQARNREAAQAQDDAAMHARRRMRIELGVQGLEEVAGQACWQAHCLDFRGRIYTANRITSHQGPDYQKAALEFAAAERLDVEGFEWLLKAAAGHWGMSRRTWAERLEWGKQQLERMVAAAADPLDRSELWCEAKDPWQFLQLARAVAQWLHDPGVPCSCPIRLDQTTSGTGIVAALTRDARIGRATNLFGDTPKDLYQQVADALAHRLTLDLHTEESRATRAKAAFWLKDGIGRSLVKGPVLAVPFGGTPLGWEEQLAAEAHARVGYVGDREIAYRCSMPARYLAKHLGEVIKEELSSVRRMDRWCKEVVHRCLRAQRPARWTAPSGWPMVLAERTPQTIKVRSCLFGDTCYLGEVTPPDGELSAKRTKPGAAANLIHSFDAAFAAAIACTSAEQGWPLLTNHDCFATTANHASTMQQALRQQMAATYQEDWLGQIAEEIRCSAGLDWLPPPPMVDTLDPGLIGSSLYGFS